MFHISHITITLLGHKMISTLTHKQRAYLCIQGIIAKSRTCVLSFYEHLLCFDVAQHLLESRTIGELRSNAQYSLGLMTCNHRE